MCLEIKSYSLFRITLFNKVVYKLIKKSKEGVMYTPFFDSVVEITKNYESELRKVDDVVHVGLHSFAHLETAKQLKEFREKQQKLKREQEYWEYVVVKCIIPRFSKYYSGKFYFFGHRYKSYASNRITYIEEVVNE